MFFSSEVKELFLTPSRKDLKSISGYLTYIDGQTESYISIESVGDSEEELNELFDVRLTSAKGGARIAENTFAELIGRLTLGFGLVYGCFHYDIILYIRLRQVMSMYELLSVTCYLTF